MAKNKRRQVVTEVVPISSDTIGDLDNGNCRRMIDREIQTIIADIKDRGDEDDKPRNLMIQVEFIKVNGRYVITPRVHSKLPPRVANSTMATEKIKDDLITSEILFQPFNAENVEQPTFAEGEIPNEK